MKLGSLDSYWFLLFFILFYCFWFICNCCFGFCCCLVYTHRRPPQGANPTMDTHDWRAQLLPHIRQTNVNKIMTELKKYQPLGGDDESLDVQKISRSLEQKTYAGALSQEDYLRKISSSLQLIYSYGWRAEPHPHSRKRIVNKIADTIKRHLPVSSEERLAELHRIAATFEDRIYNSATSQNILEDVEI